MSADGTRPCVDRTMWACALAPDPRGVPAGSSYEPLLRAGHGHTGSTGDAFLSPLLRRPIQCQSWIERALAKISHLDATFLDYREHYFIGNTTRVAQRLAASARVRKSDVPTLDAIVTHGASPSAHCSYVGYSVKPSALVDDPDVQRTLKRDEEFCNKHSWEWRLFTEKTIDHTLLRVADQLLKWAKGVEVDQTRLIAFAAAVQNMPKRYSLERVVTEASLDVHVDPATALNAFARAVLFGYLILDPRAPLALSLPVFVEAGRGF